MASLEMILENLLASIRNGTFFLSIPSSNIDREGVGELMRIAISKARQVNPNIAIGICGEVGGDPSSISFYQDIHVTYVSCSPYRVPAARLAVAQASDSSKKLVCAYLSIT